MFVGCGLGRGESGCGTRGQFTAECASISVLGPGTDASDICEWAITVQEDRIVNVTVDYFHMADTGKCTITFKSRRLLLCLPIRFTNK